MNISPLPHMPLFTCHIFLGFCSFLFFFLLFPPFFLSFFYLSISFSSSISLEPISPFGISIKNIIFIHNGRYVVHCSLPLSGTTSSAHQLSQSARLSDSKLVLLGFACIVGCTAEKRPRLAFANSDSAGNKKGHSHNRVVLMRWPVY